MDNRSMVTLGVFEQLPEAVRREAHLRAVGDVVIATRAVVDMHLAAAERHLRHMVDLDERIQALEAGSSDADRVARDEARSRAERAQGALQHLDPGRDQ